MPPAQARALAAARARSSLRCVAAGSGCSWGCSLGGGRWTGDAIATEHVTRDPVKLGRCPALFPIRSSTVLITILSIGPASDTRYNTPPCGVVGLAGEKEEDF